MFFSPTFYSFKIIIFLLSRLVSSTIRLAGFLGVGLMGLTVLHSESSSSIAADFMSSIDVPAKSPLKKVFNLCFVRLAFLI